ncbi:MAG TPA: oxidoreductase [Flavilitoribacter sp.]|nr:oxidoreductase [Flavilitoribacter sp.]HMQ88103.1 oxidoreductase [Flavilitoribacter sp.]
MKKVILITGASSGIGKATALQLIKEGHTVYGAARRVDQMEDLAQAGGHALKMDVLDEEQIVKGVRQVMDEQGKIDVLINNAGYGLYGSVEDLPLEAARRQFEVNIFGLARITKEVLPQMRERRSGKIINISSMGGKIYTPLGAWYHATKHALEGWSDCLRLELAPFKVQVVIVEPGAIATEFGDVMTDPILKNSGKGPYTGMAQKVAKATLDSYSKSSTSSPPSVIANAISRAIAARKPKTRYRAGKYAKLLVWLRVYLGDRMFDRIIMSQMG